MTFAGGMNPEHTHLAISDSENKGRTLLFFQLSFRIGIYAVKLTYARRGDYRITQGRKGKRERVCVCVCVCSCSPTLSSTQLVSISSALPAWNLQQSQRRRRIEKTRRQCLKRGVNIPVVLIRIVTWFASWQILLYIWKKKRLSSATGTRRGNRLQKTLADWIQRWYSWSLFCL